MDCKVDMSNVPGMLSIWVINFVLLLNIILIYYLTYWGGTSGGTLSIHCIMSKYFLAKFSFHWSAWTCSSLNNKSLLSFKDHVFRVD